MQTYFKLMDKKSSRSKEHNFKSGKGKIGKIGKGVVTKNENISKTKKAGLQFPVGRLNRFLKKGKYSQRVGSGAPVYLSAVLEYLTAEILELSGNASKDNKKKTIAPRHIQLAIRNDEELAKLLSNSTISSGGVIPNINEMLLPKVKKGGVTKIETDD